MFVTLRLLGLRKGEAWPPWKKTWSTGPPWIKRRYLISVKKRMIYSTSLEKWWYIGPPWVKTEILGLLKEKDVKMRKYWAPLGKNRRNLGSLQKKRWYTLPPWKNDDILDPLGGKTRDTWSPWWKNDLLNPLGDPENIWHRWYKEGSIEPPFEELFLISILSFIIFNQYFFQKKCIYFYCSSFYFNYFSNQKA